MKFRAKRKQKMLFARRAKNSNTLALESRFVPNQLPRILIALCQNISIEIMVNLQKVMKILIIIKIDSFWHKFVPEQIDFNRVVPAKRD